MGEERSERRIGKGPLSILAPTLHQALPSLISNPFVREELEVREDKVLMGGCHPPEAVSKFRTSPSCLQGSGLVSACQNFFGQSWGNPGGRIPSALAHARTRKQSMFEIEDVRKYTYFRKQFSTI